jgi:hypothetical protein
MTLNFHKNPQRDFVFHFFKIFIIPYLSYKAKWKTIDSFFTKPVSTKTKDSSYKIASTEEPISKESLPERMDESEHASSASTVTSKENAPPFFTFRRHVVIQHRKGHVHVYIPETMTDVTHTNDTAVTSFE